MQDWMIALIVIACVVAVIAATFLAGSLLAVHTILGRRVELSEGKKAKKGYSAERYGVDIKWFDKVKEFTKSMEIKSYDGLSLKATLIKHSAENSARVAICCHGYGTTPRSVQPQARLFYNRGFDVLLPAMRGHDASEGRVGMAWLDRFDLLRWLDKIINKYGKEVQIALFGVSMGGSTVIAASGMNLPAQVKCVIDDCGFSSQYDEYAACLGSLPLPASLAMLPLAAGVRLVHGYSVRSADITKFAADMTVPALFIHGEADTFVPCALGKKLFDACASPDKKFYSVPNAIHAGAYAADKQAYANEFTSFVEKYIPCELVVDEPDVLPEPEPAPAEEKADAPVQPENTEEGNKESEPAEDNTSSEKAGEDRSEPQSTEPEPAEEKKDDLQD